MHSSVIFKNSSRVSPDDTGIRLADKGIPRGYLTRTAFAKKLKATHDGSKNYVHKTLNLNEEDIL